MGSSPMSSAASIDWLSLLRVFLHDPVDKALDIRGHETRAARYATAALGEPVTRGQIKSDASLADVLAAVAERLPMPTAGPNGERAVSPENGRLRVNHPISGARTEIECGPVDERRVARVIGEIVEGLDTPRERFFALWRLLPERLEAEFGEWMNRLPADTRVPDHSLTHHADLAAGFWASRQGGRGAYLSFALGPVQSFIEAARSVRDLWSGSAILSWLAFEAMRPVFERFGPTSFIYPSLRGNPLMDLWLRRELGLDRVPMPDPASRRSPSLPNRFIALVPQGVDGSAAGLLAEQCEAAARDAWHRLAEAVRRRLDSRWGTDFPGWDRRWSEQIADSFAFSTTVVPEHELDDEEVARLLGGGGFSEVWPHSAAIRELAAAIPERDRPGYAQDGAGRWQAHMEFSARVMGANRQVRQVPAPTGNREPGAMTAAKCTLLGSWEQMGPEKLRESDRFWNGASELSIDGVRLRSGERLSAVALAKRFSAPACLAEGLDLPVQAMRFPDTATVAAAEWLRKAKLDPEAIRRQHGSWSGRWLHRAEDDGEPAPAEVSDRIRQLRKAQGPPPAYFAILKLDGDDIGGWLRGEKTAPLADLLPPKILGYYRAVGGPVIEKALAARRPVGPALHASISAALGDFAARTAPEIVRNKRGTVIYSGGDDLLALLPASRALECAEALRSAYCGESSGEAGRLRGMGHRATVSAGIAFVHHMEDLRLALGGAREAEKAAKTMAGKNAVGLRFRRRSGERAEATIPWSLADWFHRLTQLFERGATDRWAYRLRSELPVLCSSDLPPEAVAAEIRRLGNRIEDPLWKSDGERPGDRIERWWKEVRDALRDRRTSDPEALEAFAILCQGAAFVARGRDG